MSYNFLRHPAVLLIAAATIVACHSSGTSTAAPTPSGGAAARASSATPSAVTPASIALGDSIFHARGCKNCHGPTGTGAANGPNLTGPTFLHVDGTFNGFVQLITTGVPADQIKDPAHKIPMGARGGRPTPLTDDQIKAVASYVYTLSHH